MSKYGLTPFELSMMKAQENQGGGVWPRRKAAKGNPAKLDFVKRLVGRLEESAKSSERASEMDGPRTTRAWDRGRGAGFRDAIEIVEDFFSANTQLSELA